MKKKWVFIGVIVILSCIGIYLDAQKPLEENIELRNRLVKAMDIAQREEMLLDMGQIAAFEWAHIYLMTPYVSVKEYCDQYGLHYRNLDTNIEYNDGTNVLVFTQDQSIVAFVEVPRVYGDFVFDNESLSKEEAVMTYDKGRNKWVVAEPY